MVDRLDSYLAGRSETYLWKGTVTSGGEGSLDHAATAVEGSPGERSVERCSAFAELFVIGQEVDLARLYEPFRHRRVALPGYPFQRSRYWITDLPGGGTAADLPVRESQSLRLPEIGRPLEGLAKPAPLTRPRRRLTETESVVVTDSVSAGSDHTGTSGVLTDAVQEPSSQFAATRSDKVSQHEAGPKAVARSGADVSRTLLELLAAAMFVEVGSLQPDRPLTDQGLDSILGVEFINAVNRRFQLSFKTTAIYRFPTVEALAAEIVQSSPLAESGSSLREDGPESVAKPLTNAVAATEGRAVDPQTEPATSQRDSGREPIAIIGMACRFPGADSVDDFWQLLQDGRDTVADEPPARPWSASRRPGGYLSDIDRFDAAFFSVSPAEAVSLDPQQRIFLEEAYHAIEDALLRPDEFRGSRCGVFAGVATSGYERLAATDELDRFALTGSLPSMLPSRIAYSMDLRGPVMAIDTACSSSLVAVHEACESLRRGDCDLALAGGITLLLNDEAQELTAQFEMNSPTGRCRPFDDAADGVVWSEGCGIVVLKPLYRALADGDRVHAVIRGSGVNHDGASNGITAPNADSQAALITRVDRLADVDPATIGYVEAHGTGTSLGDPIELEGLTAAFGQRAGNAPRCAIGSVKSNIGHTALAAGIAGLIKTVLCLRERTLVPTLHVEQPNRHFDFEASPFELSREARLWEKPANGLRRAAVSSFGLSGTNAHVVLEEAGAEPREPDGEEVSRRQGKLTLIISARTPEALRDLAARYWKRISDADERLLPDICFSAATCRPLLRERAVIEFASKEAALQQLAANAAILPNAMAEIASLIAGLHNAVDRPLRRVTLPSYPFQRERYWFRGHGVLPARHGTETLPAEVTLQRRVDLQSWPWLADHEVFGRTIAPGALLVALVVDAAAARRSPAAIGENAYAATDSDELRPGASAADRRNAVRISRVELRAPLEIHSGRIQALRLQSDAAVPHRIVIGSRSETSSDSSDGWIEHLRCVVDESCCSNGDRDASDPVNIEQLKERLVPKSSADCYATIEAVGIRLGPAMRGLRRVWSAGTEALGEIVLPAEVTRRTDAAEFALAHPVLLDSCLQLASVMVLDANLTDAFVPVGIGSIEIEVPLSDHFYCHLTLARPFQSDAATLRADLELIAADGVRLGCLTGFVAQRVSRDALLRSDSVGPQQEAADEAVDKLLYSIDWETIARRRPLELTPLAELPGSLLESDGPADADELTWRACGSIWQAFQNSGISLEIGASLTTDVVAEKLGLIPKYVRLAERLLAILIEKGFLTDVPGGFRVTAVPRRFDHDTRADSPEGRLLTRCGENLGDVLAGRVDPLSLLFPGEGISAEDVYRDSQTLRRTNAVISKFVQQALTSAEQRDPDEVAPRVISILEVGAGTGATTTAILETLGQLADADQITARYVFSDVSPAFLHEAEAKLVASAPPWVELQFETLDLDRPLDDQGFEQREFDIVIAANVLHATRDVPASLQRLHELLAPLGLLVLAEATGRHAPADLTFGLLDGWWHFADSVRTDYPLLSSAQWLDVLQQTSFAPLSLTSSGERQLTIDCQQTVIVSRVQPTTSRRHWLIVAQQCDAAETLAAALAESDAAVDVVHAEHFLATDSEQGIGDHVTGVVYLADFHAVDDPATDELARRIKSQGTSLLELVRGVARGGRSLRDGFWLVTQHGVAMSPTEQVCLDQSPLWGILTGVATERRELNARRIDLDDFGGQVGDLAAELSGSTGEDTIALRGRTRLVPRLRSGAGPSEQSGVAIRSGVTYLITGGAGGLGLETARWLVERGATSIVLVGRCEPHSAVRSVIDSLCTEDVRVQFVVADVSRQADVRRVVEEIRQLEFPLAGVFHAAGTLDDAAIDGVTWSRFETVFAPKLWGAWHLHRLTRDEPLELFVLYSSTAAVLGSHGQANHAAANQFLDQLAQHRRALGLPAVSINWGPWSRVGEAARRAGDVEPRMRELGFDWLTPKAGLECLERVLRSNTVQSVAVAIDWQHFVDASRARPFFGDLVVVSERRFEQSSGSAADRGDVTAFIAAEAASLLRMRTVPTADDSFFDLGMDSLMAVELRNRLNAEYAPNPPLTSTAVFDHPTPAKLAALVVERLRDSRHNVDTQLSSAVAPTSVTRQPNEPIAIIGMACRFPGASSLDEFETLLFDGRDAISTVPASRWDADSVAAISGAEATCFGGWVDGAEFFDAEFFGISPREALRMDPQQRITLECVWEALEHAGVAPDRLAGSRTGVFLGVSEADYGRRVMASLGDVDFYAGTGTSASFVAGRVSHALGLTGPSHVVDTVCSSSLVALHQACQSLRSAEADMAITGGVHLMLSPDGSIALQKTGALSPDGRCRTFDTAANGFARAEGCGIVVLKRLADAERDGDDVLAVVRGSAVNHDGASGGLTIPSGPAQQRVIQAALQQAGVASHEVDYLEAHGTGTSLGDPIELHAAAEVLGTGRETPLLVGSVKANIGHAEAAAGIAGVIKVVLAMQAGRLPGQVHFETPNPHIDWERLPVRVVDRVLPWPQQEMVAGVSSFGLSGTNAHVVLAGKQKPSRGERREDNSPRASILVLSARDERALRELAGRYAAWFARHPDASLSDVCATAVRRTHFACRLAVAADSVAALRKTLEEVAATGASGHFVVAERTPLESAMRQAAEDFVTGRSTDLSQLQREEPTRRMHLPNYPFLRTRYWIDPPGTVVPRETAELLVRDHASDSGSNGQASEDAADSRFDRKSLVALIRDQVQESLELPSPPSTTALLTDLGVDSMVAVEIQEGLRQRVDPEMDLPATVALEYPTIERLTDAVLVALSKRNDASAGTPRTDRVENDAAATASTTDLDGLSDDEIAAQLDDEISAVLGGRHE